MAGRAASRRRRQMNALHKAANHDATPAQKPPGPARWRLDVTDAPPSALAVLAKLKFRRTPQGLWRRPVFTAEQGAFLIEKLKAAGCHGRPVVIAAEFARAQQQAREIAKTAARRFKATAADRKRDLAHQEEQRLEREAYQRAEDAAKRAKRAPSPP